MKFLKIILIVVFLLIVLICGLVLAGSDNLYIAFIGFFILIAIIPYLYKVIKKHQQ